MSMEWWIFEWLVEVDGWTDCAITDFWLWTSVPVIGLITLVIGLRSLWLDFRSLWLDFGPCDWAHHPCVPDFRVLTSDFWLLTSDCGFDLVWWLVWGFGGWSWDSFRGWYICEFLVFIRLISCCSWLWLVGFFMVVVQLVSCYGFVVLYSRYWIIGFVWMSLGLWFVQLIVVEYLFWTIE